MRGVSRGHSNHGHKFDYALFRRGEGVTRDIGLKSKDQILNTFFIFNLFAMVGEEKRCEMILLIIV